MAYKSVFSFSLCKKMQLSKSSKSNPTLLTHTLSHPPLTLSLLAYMSRYEIGSCLMVCGPPSILLLPNNATNQAKKDGYEAKEWENCAFWFQLFFFFFLIYRLNLWFLFLKHKFLFLNSPIQYKTQEMCFQNLFS